MKYVRWTDADGPLEKGLVEEWTEVDDDGNVVRDIGFDASGHVAYRWPDARTNDDHGRWDMALVEESAGTDLVDPLEFEQAWSAPPSN